MLKERTYELNRIRQFLSKQKLGGLLIYGKEDTGKNSLVHMACKDSLAKKVFINVGNENKDVVISNIRAKCQEAFPDIEQPQIADVSQSLKLLFEQSVNQKIILVINDIHLLYKIAPEISAFFENFRSRFKSNGNIKVICISSIYQTKLDYENPKTKIKPLFDDYIEIEPFDYLEASSFYSRVGHDDKLSYYSVFGGSPLYNSLINPSKNFETNLKELLLYRDSPLRNKIDADLHKAISKKYEADGLLAILGKKQFSKYGELKSEFKSYGLAGDFDYILNKLIEIGVIAKKAPLHYENDKKKYFYMFADPLYDFFYSHVYRNTESDILPEEIDKKYENVIKDEFEDKYLPRRLVFITLDFIKREGEKGKFKEEVMNVAPYFSNPLTLEFDGTLVVETISGNYYVLINASKKQIDKKKVNEFAYSLYEKQKPFKKLIIVSRGMIASNVSRTKYITYRMGNMYSKN